MTKPEDGIAKFDLRSEDIAEARRQELLRLFPEVHTESGGINFEALRLSLGDAAQVGPEGFGMSWPGKAECVRTIQRQSLATLLPVQDESIDWDTTQNLIIEGDNLEVLKVLQKAYLGKVKMIYIDPPYNTGNDFIYPDNYSESLKTYLQYTGQVDDEGHKFSTNTEASGRFHSKWMNMMYPRLKLAQNLLSEDGVIFVSIDDSEIANLFAICFEVFGEGNYMGNIIRATNSTKSVSNYLSINYDYTLVFARSKQKLDELVGVNGKWEVDKNNIMEYKASIKKLIDRKLSGDEISRELKELTNYPRFIDFVNYWYVDERGVYRKGDLGGVQNGNFEPIHNPITQKPDPVPPGGFRFKPERLQELVSDNRVHFDPDGALPTIKRYLDENSKQRPKGIMSDDQRPDGTRLERYGAPFSNPKQLAFMERIVSIFPKDSLVLDFFAGSGTTGHAVIAQNAKDGGSRKYILVQLPEPLANDSKAAKSGCKSIADITKRRMRMAAEEISKQADIGSKLDFEGNSDGGKQGFRVFRLEESNFAVWDANSIEGDELKLEQQLFAQVEHVLPGRTNQDILFELMLKSRYELTTPIEAVNVGKCEVWKVAGGVMVAVIDSGLTIEVIREIAGWKPASVVILDRCFGADDSLKANARKIFEDSKVDLKTV